jgi:1-deoxy-D-xylulose-5-phosphate synthase
MPSSTTLQPSLLPSQLKGLSLPELEALAGEIRQEIISACLKNGGHLGASLGTVELAIALHAVFESPHEPIVWDVGHQAYAHKLLTGRWDRFSTLRTEGGISGFLSRDESVHDVFGAGHSSTSLSAALALSTVREEAWTVAVIGDGGLSAGLAFEALNNFRSVTGGPLLIVLNDNQMSISPNVGSISAILGEGRGANFFELFGMSFEGPVNGHDLQTLIPILKKIRAEGSAEPRVVLHVMTQKGRGYAPAEDNPATFHGVGPISPVSASAKKAPTYSDAFGEALCELAEKDERIVAITAAMPEGTGLLPFSRKFPDRFYDVGIAEAHAVTFAAALATQGLRPVVAIYSTFLQRAYDSIIHDLALQGLPVVLAIDRAGPVGADGPTHHGMFDLAYLGPIPGITLHAPACLSDLRAVLANALQSHGPIAIRYPRGAGVESLEGEQKDGFRVHQRAKSPKAIIVGVGVFAAQVAAVARKHDPEAKSVSAYSLTQVKPIPEELLGELAAHPEARLLSIESGASPGGAGQRLLAALAERVGRARVAGFSDRFFPHGSVSSIDQQAGLDAAGIGRKLQELLSL